MHRLIAVQHPAVCTRGHWEALKANRKQSRLLSAAAFLQPLYLNKGWAVYLLHTWDRCAAEVTFTEWGNCHLISAENANKCQWTAPVCRRTSAWPVSCMLTCSKKPAVFPQYQMSMFGFCCVLFSHGVVWLELESPNGSIMFHRSATGSLHCRWPHIMRWVDL